MLIITTFEEKVKKEEDDLVSNLFHLSSDEKMK
jgi:hypothetical protein